MPCLDLIKQHHQVTILQVPLQSLDKHPITLPALNHQEITIPGLISMSNSELFKSLCKANLLPPCPATVATPPYPHWYNLSHVYEYHSNTLGHSIVHYYEFKDFVWHLLDTKVIKVPRLGKEEAHVGISSI